MKVPARPWSDEDELYLTTNAGRFTAEYIGLRLGRSAASVRSKAHLMGVRFTDGHKWTNAEEFYLKSNAAHMMAKEVAADLGLPVQSVLSKAAHMGVRFGIYQRHSDEQVREVLRLHKKGLSYAAIESRTGISAGVFKEYIGGRRRKSITGGRRRKSTTAREG